MGCLPSLIVLLGIISFVIYAIGGFNDGLGGVIENLKVFINGQGTIATPQITTEKTEETTQKLNENFSESAEENKQTRSEQRQPEEPQEQTQNSLMQLVNNLTNGVQKNTKPKDINDLPSFTSQVTVLTADTLNAQGYKIKLYGVVAPDLTQTCANKTGASYYCGKQAALWLSSWLKTNPVTCRVMKEYENGNMVAACSLGQYDLGAAIINAGWAVADPKTGDIYAPYQEKARQKRDGLWQGNFYMPWDWKAMQNRKPQYKIIQTGPKRKSFFKF